MDGSETPQGRRQEISQRLDAIRTRIEELEARHHGDAARGGAFSERVAAAQRHAAAAQTAAQHAIAASVRALRRAAEAHERVAREHERAAASGVGDTAEHERQAAVHRAAAAADTQRADQFRSLLQDQTDDGRGSEADQALIRLAVAARGTVVPQSSSVIGAAGTVFAGGQEEGLGETSEPALGVREGSGFPRCPYHSSPAAFRLRSRAGVFPASPS